MSLYYRKQGHCATRIQGSHDIRLSFIIQLLCFTDVLVSSTSDSDYGLAADEQE